MLVSLEAALPAHSFSARSPLQGQNYLETEATNLVKNLIKTLARCLCAQSVLGLDHVNPYVCLLRLKASVPGVLSRTMYTGTHKSLLDNKAGVSQN